MDYVDCSHVTKDRNWLRAFLINFRVPQKTKNLTKMMIINFSRRTSAERKQQLQWQRSSKRRDSQDVSITHIALPASPWPASSNTLLHQ